MPLFQDPILKLEGRRRNARCDLGVSRPSALQTLSVKLHLRDRPSVRPSLRWSLTRTNERTDGRTNERRGAGNRIWSILVLKVTPGGNNFNNFPDNQLTKFRVFIG